MPTDKGDIVAQRQQLGHDRVNQRGVVAIGEIRAADRALEQHVADHVRDEMQRRIAAEQRELSVAVFTAVGRLAVSGVVRIARAPSALAVLVFQLLLAAQAVAAVPLWMMRTGVDPAP